MAIIESSTVAAIIAKAVAPKVLSELSTALKKKGDVILSSLQSTFEPHISMTLERCSRVNTIFTDNDKVNLKSIYTNIYLESNDKKCRDEEFLDFILKNELNSVISATGGAGKTMLMKYLALFSIENNVGKIPLFIELRNIPHHKPQEFFKTIFENVAPEQHFSKFSIFKAGMEKGLFLFFFDGLDEVKQDMRGQIFNSINRTNIDYKNCRIIISTRPDADVRRWGSLSFFKISGLNLEQTKTLIKKTPFDTNQKEKFFSLLDSDFFKKHESFLSIPLLCLLMLQTFHEYQEIPSRLTVFYEQSFETLMRAHDRSKEGFYKRDHECGLSPDRFRTLFSAFCYRTLALGVVSFTDDEIRQHVVKSADAIEIDVDPDKYISDLASGVCVIMRDGLKLHFIHRSFQEYFSALFLLRNRTSEAFKQYNRLVGGPSINDTLIMAHDIDRNAFERDWSMPAIAEVMKTLRRVSKPRVPRYLVEKLVSEFRLGGSDVIHAIPWEFENTQISSFLKEIVKVYRREFNHLNFSFIYIGDNDESWTDFDAKGIQLPKGLLDSQGNSPIEEGNRQFYGIVVKSSSLSDELTECLGFLKETSNFLEDLKLLEKEVKKRVISREELDILA